jgi:FO synthase
MEQLIRGAGRIPQQRSTVYGTVTEERRRAGRMAAPLSEMINPPAGKRARIQPECATTSRVLHALPA